MALKPLIVTNKCVNLYKYLKKSKTKPRKLKINHSHHRFWVISKTQLPDLTYVSIPLVLNVSFGG